jgi:uroporphyrinogen decarboxylase
VLINNIHLLRDTSYEWLEEKVTEADKNRRLRRALAGEPIAEPVWWLMRQAGRYLPEYRRVRSQARDFVELCRTPSLAAELTLQPVRRYGMDAAILFSDILLLPHALGQRLEFREGEGPVLDPIFDVDGLRRLERGQAISRLEPVWEAVRRVRKMLAPEISLIGFAGAPWTVAAYMVEGGASRDFSCVKGWGYRDPHGFAALIDLLVETTIAALTEQIRAGVDVVQLFDSWAGVLPERAYDRWVIAPTRAIVAGLKRRFPEVPIIGFPRGSGLLYEAYVTQTGVDAISLDTMTPLAFARDRLQRLAAVQGNLDPAALLAGGKALATAVRELRQSLGGGAWVFNLGHGVLPSTPPENVAELARLLAIPVEEG